MVTRTEAIPVVTRWHWMPQDLFGDLRLRYGIKMGLAGLIALFCTQVLRLPHDNWAILTVLVLMSAQFVGSITFKAIMRVIGTIAGALVGIWLVGDTLIRRRSFCLSFSWSSLLPATSLANSVQARFPMLIFCSVSPRLPSLRMGSRIQHKHGRSASTDRRRFWSES
jgi:fusaric acid resistance family protein